MSRVEEGIVDMMIARSRSIVQEAYVSFMTASGQVVMEELAHSIDPGCRVAKEGAARS